MPRCFVKYERELKFCPDRHLLMLACLRPHFTQVYSYIITMSTQVRNHPRLYPVEQVLCLRIHASYFAEVYEANQFSSPVLYKALASPLFLGIGVCSCDLCLLSFIIIFFFKKPRLCNYHVCMYVRMYVCMYVCFALLRLLFMGFRCVFFFKS
jgi:hypothetical protein